MTKRNDIHRVGAIIPENYAYVLSYALPTQQAGWPVPGYNVDLALKLMAGEKFAAHGGLGKCSVCGARFLTGDVWRHSSGEHIHIGYDCAMKYELIVDRGDFDSQIEALKQASAAERIKAQKASEIASFLAKHDGLEDALKVDHHIVRDIAAKFRHYHSLSDKQVAFVFKLAAEVNAPKSVKPEVKKVPAPIASGRQTVRGVIGATKVYDGDYGSSYKMLVKVQTPDGEWVAWGTIPSSFTNGDYTIVELRGATIEFDAKLEAGRNGDVSFAVFSRPTKASIEVPSDAMKARDAERAERMAS